MPVAYLAKRASNRHQKPRPPSANHTTVGLLKMPCRTDSSHKRGPKAAISPNTATNRRWVNCETRIQGLIFVLASLAIIAVIVHFYRKEPDYVKRRKKIYLGVLRFLGCSVLLVILAGPVLEVVRSDVVKSTVVLVFDQSDSMNFDDRRVEAAQLLLAAKATGKVAMSDGADALAGLTPDDRKALERIKRVDVVKGLLANRDLGLMNSLEERFEVATYGFDSSLRNIALAPKDAVGGPGSTLEASGPTTKIGTALRDLTKQMKGRYVAGIVLVTDGGSNKGEDPLITAEEIGVPVYPVGVGLPEAKDIQISYIFAEDVVFVEDRAPVYVRIKQKGYGGRQASLQLYKCARGETDVTKGEMVVEKEITFSDGGEQTETLHMIPTPTNIYTFVARIEPRPEEMIAENNQRAKEIKVIDDKIKVLMIDGAPRYQFRFVHTLLKRDKRIELKILQRSADPEVVLPGSPYLKNFPSEPEEFFKHDLVILGNVDQEFFTESELQLLYRFVDDEGGAILFMAGRNKMPDSYEEITFTPEDGDTEVRFIDLLPVNIERQPTVTGRDQMASSAVPYSISLTPEGRNHTITRLDIDPEINAESWEGMPRLYWFYNAISLKPGATALVNHDSERTRDGQPMPIVAVQRFGKGRTMYVGTDELWSWRYKPGPDAHARFWGQSVQFLAMAHLLGESKRIQLTTDRKSYGVGDKVKITARVLDPSYSPLAAPSVDAKIQVGEVESHKATLNMVPGTPGMFRGEFVPQGQGMHRLSLPDQDEDMEIDFEVVIPRIEFDNPGMRWDFLEEVARNSGGEARRVDGLMDLAETIDAGRQKALITGEDELWDAPIMAILFVLFFGLEWFTRKRSDLC